MVKSYIRIAIILLSTFGLTGCAGLGEIAKAGIDACRDGHCR